MSKFQIILLIVFGAFILAAVGLFSVYRGSSGDYSNITVWGPLTSIEFSNFVTNANLDTKTLTFTYIEKKEASIEKEYTEALALGQGPDLIILSEPAIYKNKGKIRQIPYTSVSLGDYQNTFIGEGDLFFGPEGLYALPIMVDPLVLYWNKDIISSAGFAKPITYWDELYAATEKLTVKDAAGNITRSAIALGETKNIPHFKEILSLLMIQAGTPITQFNSVGTLDSMLTSGQGTPLNPASAAVDFYTQFSNSAKPFYSWNRSLLPAASSFSVGDSAMYIGFASELRSLKAKSPTLNIGVSAIPQSRTSKSSVTYGKLYGVAISRQAPNPGTALQAAYALVSSVAQPKLSAITGLPPIRRDLLSIKPNNQADQVFYTSAIQAKGWVDPDSQQTQNIFREMLDSVTSGRARTSEAVAQAHNALEALIDSQD